VKRGDFMSEKLTALRQAMAKKGFDACIIPGSDAHQSEYFADHWRTRHWLSGFTGSNGLVVVTPQSAGLWTDGRYFIQAEKELIGSGITLFKMGEPGVPTYSEWLADNLPKTASIGFDGRVLSVSEFEDLKNDLDRNEVSYHYNEDIAGALWPDRPALPTDSAFAHDIRFTGKTTEQKLADVRTEMKKKRADIYLTSALDDIAWLTNIRGNDVPNTPVVYAYLLISMEAAYLFIDNQKIDSALTQHLSGITICPYEDVFDYIRTHTAGKTFLYNPKGVSVKLFDAVASTAKAVKSPSIITELKAIKNETEIENFKSAFFKEGVVMVRLLRWLSEQKNNMPEETDVQAKVSALRLQQEHCLGDSFTTIAAYGENAALMHYSPKLGHCAKIKPEGFLLVDTGGQYLDGTTDITRTIVMGPISDEMRRDFTLVLKGHIALARVKFLQGTAGIQLDVLARQPIWEAGMDYRSGTGHGLGFCLGVHEGPQSISIRFIETKLAPGMLCTNEPGIYKEGRYGIRTENVMLVKELESTEHGTFLGFESISLCPIDTSALDKSLLTQAEVDYLNDYHRQVFEKLSPHLTQEEREWLKEATKAV